MVTNRYKFLPVSIAMLTAIGFTACTNDLKAPDGGNVALVTSPVGTPDIVAWSGQQTLANTFSGNVAGYTAAPVTRSANVNGNMWYQDWDTPTNVTEAEIQKVLEAVKDPIYKQNDIKIDWTNYWVQQVYKGQAQYTDGAGNTGIKGSDRMNHLLAYNENYSETIHGGYNDPNNNWQWVPTVTINHYEHINNFNSGDNQTVFTENNNGANPGAQYKGTTLMTDMDSSTVDAQHQFGYHNSVDSKDHFEYIIIEVDGNYYVCFDFYATPPVGQEANKNMSVERDYIYNDWIVKISPAYPKGTTPEGGVTPPDIIPSPLPLPDGDDADPKCKHCDHDIVWNGNEWVHLSSNDAVCTEGDCAVEHDTPCTNPMPYDDDTMVEDPTPEKPGSSDNSLNHVEINFALNDIHSLPDGSNKYDIEDLVTKLSIHVRYPKDVEVVIPVPAYIYCDQDDLMILNNHYEGNYTYGGESISYPIPVGNNTVTLSVEFVTADNDQLTAEHEGYIRVWTTGINEEVIDYCRTHFGDGINFEVYNYYSMSNDPSTNFGYTELQRQYLDLSFVNFDWQHDTGSEDKELPQMYVNAFNSLGGNPNPGDCFVRIMGDEDSAEAYTSNGHIYREGNQAENIVWGASGSQKEYFLDGYQGYHYNGSPFNWIFKRK